MHREIPQDRRAGRIERRWVEAREVERRLAVLPRLAAHHRGEQRGTAGGVRGVIGLLQFPIGQARAWVLGQFGGQGI